MKILDNLITRWAERIHQKQADRWNSDEVATPTPRKGRGGGNLRVTSGNRRVEHNYDDASVITFKVYGASGGKIVETARYDDKRDNESFSRYVISEDDDLTESLSKIVTLEYLK